MGSSSSASNYSDTNQTQQQQTQSNTTSVNNINNSKLANIAQKCGITDSEVQYKINNNQFQSASNNLVITGNDNVVDHVNQALTTTFGNLLSEQNINCMQSSIVDFGATEAAQNPGDVSGGNATGGDAEAKAETAQKASAAACNSSSGLFGVGGCAGSNAGTGKGGGGGSAIIIILVIVAVIIAFGFIGSAMSKKNKASQSGTQYN
ncbi:hypothetical protein CPAV1605_816 [seawater metagenome]|uniref:Uncharacterized protein n=1 Tax=seawater metagenome TaxID=1561972 RepID=A0A5E8CIP7_9ZZZZ